MITLLGIAGPSLLVVAAIRRWISPVLWRIAALFLVLTLAFLHGAVFTTKLPVPVDEVARGYPWRAFFPEVTEAGNALTNDTTKALLPWMQVAREELFRGRAPLWNRYSFSGYPLLANAQSAPFSPFFLATLFVPLPKQIVAMAGLKIFVALLFTYLLARRWGRGDGASIFAACTFAFCTFQSVYLYYPLAAATALLPAAVFALCEAAGNPSRSRTTLVAAVIAALLASGHPESVFHIAIAAVIFLVFENGREWRRWITPLTGVVAGLLISAPAWVPVLEQVRHSERFVHAVRAAHPVFPKEMAWSLIAPNHFGNPAHHDWNWIANYAVFATSYFGLLPLALFAWSTFSKRAPARERGFAGVAALFFLIAMNWTLIGRWINLVPPFSITANDRLRFVCVLIAALVASRVVTRFAWLAILIVLADLFFYNAAFNALVDSKYFRPPLPVIDALRRHQPAEPFRVVGRDWVLLPNASAQYGLEDVRGTDPMELASYAAFFKTFSTQEPGTDVKRVTDVERPELDFLNVRFLIAEPDAQLGGKWKLLYRGADGTLFENANAERRFFSATAEITRIENRDPRVFRVDVRARTQSTIMSSQPNGPGWRLRIDGKRARIDSGAFIRFTVPAGEHRVKLDYRPRTFYWSLAASLLGLALLVFHVNWRSSSLVRRPR